MLAYIGRRDWGSNAEDVSAVKVIGPIAQDGVNSAATSAVGLHLSAIFQPEIGKRLPKTVRLAYTGPHR